MFLQVVVLGICGVAAAVTRPLTYKPTTASKEKSSTLSSGGSIPYDPYFTSGVQQVWREDGTLLFEESFGYKSRKYDVPLEINGRFRVGSNTKLFTAVAIYQLHERGLLNVTHSVTEYLDQSDFEKFGYPEQTEWCPTVYGGDGSCEQITFVQMMSMSSGMVDGLNCAYEAGSWELDYCQNPAIYQSYVGSIASVVGGFINWPLSTEAGEEFHYTNENFILLAYLVEKLSGLSYREYIKTHILDVIGLEDTYYDPWKSSLGPLDAKIGEGYRDYHDFSTTSDVAASYYASSLCSDELNPGAISGTGALVSTTADMHTWYSNLFIDYNSKLLTPESINALIAPHQLTSSTSTTEYYFGQGVGVDYTTGASELISIHYTGGMYCETTSIVLLTATESQPTIISTAFRNNVLVDAPPAELKESLNSVSGTFYDIGYVEYGWDMNSDTSIVDDLATYFQENPEETTTAQEDDDNNDTILIAITVCSILAALAFGAALLYLLRPGRQFEETNERLTYQSPPLRESHVPNPNLTPVPEDECF